VNEESQYASKRDANEGERKEKGEKEKTNLDGVDLTPKLTRLVGSNRGSNHRARNTASATKGSLGGDKDVRDVLVLAEEGEVEEDLDGFRVGGHDDELADTAVEGLLRVKRLVE
jgi:hypothetical protein